MRVSVTCEILEGNLPITFTWYHNGDPLPIRSDSISISHPDEYSNRLVINHVTAEHNGEFTCLAANDAGQRNYTSSLQINGKLDTENTTNVPFSGARLKTSSRPTEHLKEKKYVGKNTSRNEKQGKNKLRTNI